SSSTVAPPKDTGEEIPIARTAPSQAQVDEWLHVPGTPVIAVETPGRPVITVVTKVNSADVQARCAFFDPSDEQPPQSPWAGLRGSCFPMTHIAETLLMVEENLPSSPIVSYGNYVWTEVPHGAAYVTFEAGATRAWQRPLDGVVDFPLAGDGRSEHLSLPVVVRAFDENGQQLAEAHAAP